ncbi:Glycosyl transferase family 2 [Pseudoxanthomonas sp. GM95]|uniref:glycosyltransferase n=1 Tax=Pseudoxanthomonas sp. GM95 TaxID=1881043 RepID=UPI0008AA8470|nr:glycosyltransferase [Pseudoxanthomonas sp. GM95]SEM09365.1 Glycosyl transferase family 2 [Pseudoxanthomonas sp. GM95]
MLSLILPAHDEALVLPQTLSVLQQAVLEAVIDAEIIVVDDASSDDTAALAIAAGVEVIRIEARHIAAARNAGATIARGDQLCFIDADTHVDAHLLRAAMQAMEGGAIGGGARVKLQRPVAWHARVGEVFFGSLLRLARIAPGCFLFCTREAFSDVGGFDPRYFAGEDVAMSRALARRGHFVLLREIAWTSPRKLHTFSAWEHLKLFALLARHGRGMLHSRERLGFWYGNRRTPR